VHTSRYELAIDERGEKKIWSAVRSFLREELPLRYGGKETWFMKVTCKQASRSLISQLSDKS